MTKKMILAITIACAIQNSFTMHAEKSTNRAFLNLLQKNPEILIFSRRIDKIGKVKDLEYIRNAKDLHKEWTISNINRDEVSNYIYVIESDLRSDDCTMCTFSSGKQAIIANLHSEVVYGDQMYIFEADTNSPLAISQTKESISNEAEKLYNYHQSLWLKPWMPLSTNDIKKSIIK